METEKPRSNIQKSTASGNNFKLKIFLLGSYQIIMVFLLAYLLIKIWPNNVIENGKKVAEDMVNVLGMCVVPGSETGLLLLVIVAGALGSYIHAATSFVDYVGNKSLVMSWGWWYTLRPFIGAALALVFYFVIRGGLLSTNSGGDNISVFGIAAVAGLVGMFSKQATDKLGEVFNTLFRTKDGGGDDKRKDKLGDKVSVSDKMIPLNKISSFVIEDDKKVSEIKIEELFNLLSDTVTRIPVLVKDNRLKYVIHQSILFKFIFEESINASKNGKLFDVKALTFEDFLKHEGIKQIVSDAIAFVPKDSTILTAKDAMEKIKSCQDVFVTENGSREEEILGWLTNVDITKWLSV
jgi:hypothetical protein